MGKFFVYALIDPRTNTPFYIGKGTGRRPLAHFENNTRGVNPFKDSVIEKIQTMGLKPYSEIINSNLTEAEAFQEEKRLIKLYGRRDQRHDGMLTNLTDGGEGQSGKIVSEMTKQKIKNKMMGSGNHFFGKKHSNETKKKIGNRIYIISEEQKEKIRTSLKGRPKSDEWKEKIRNGLTGKKKTPEHIEKMAATKRNKPISEEHKRKISQSSKGKPKSEEMRRKNSESLKRYWAKKRKGIST